jgi:site-specific DNA-cytosine methylase
MKVLIACAYSGMERDEFARLGHDAWSCDLQESETQGNHIVGDVLEILDDGWDLMVAHPPCQDLSVVGARMWSQKIADGRQWRAIQFVLKLWHAPIPRIAIENPVGALSTRWRPYDQVVDPYHFGDPYQKRTCLWLKGLPPLRHTDVVAPIGPWVGGGKGRHSAREELAGSKKNRNRSFTGMSRAMAEQWSKVDASFYEQPSLFDS